MGPPKISLRRLALNDEKAVGMVPASASDADVELLPKVDLLVWLGALVAVGAATASLRGTVELALGAGDRRRGLNALRLHRTAVD